MPPLPPRKKNDDNGEENSIDISGEFLPSLSSSSQGSKDDPQQKTNNNSPTTSAAGKQNPPNPTSPGTQTKGPVTPKLTKLQIQHMNKAILVENTLKNLEDEPAPQKTTTHEILGAAMSPLLPGESPELFTRDPRPLLTTKEKGSSKRNRSSSTSPPQQNKRIVQGEDGVLEEVEQYLLHNTID